MTLEVTLAADAALAERKVEKVAEVIYEKMEYISGSHSPDFKPKWQPGGNSDKQEEARDMARAAIAVLDAARVVEAALAAATTDAAITATDAAYFVAVDAATRAALRFNYITAESAADTARTAGRVAAAAFTARAATYRVVAAYRAAAKSKD